MVNVGQAARDLKVVHENFITLLKPYFKELARRDAQMSDSTELDFFDFSGEVVDMWYWDRVDNHRYCLEISFVDLDLTIDQFKAKLDQEEEEAREQKAEENMIELERLRAERRATYEDLKQEFDDG